MTSFTEWLPKAGSGEMFIYHTGPNLALCDKKVLSMVRSAYDYGYIYLKQKRVTGTSIFEYTAERRTRRLPHEFFFTDDSDAN